MSTSGIDEIINEFVAPATKILSDFIFYAVPIGGVEVPLVVAWLVLGGLFCTFYFRVLTFKSLKHTFYLLRGDFTKPENKGQISHFSALTTALSGTVGVGNIGAVAILVTLGGPGAVFWMIAGGLLGASIKFTECVLGVKYRNENPDDTVSGGPMYYLEKGLAHHNRPRLGKFIGSLYASAMVVGCLGIGNMFQSNQAYVQFVTVTGQEDSFFADKGWLIGIILALIVGFVIIGGIQAIARVTSRLVPLMAGIYVTSALVVITMNAEKVPQALSDIVTQAFDPRAMSGGVLAVLVLGFKRAVFSNEAGIGSASIAHSAVKTNEPITEGLVGLLEPLIDTVFICTLTALVILTTVYDPSSASSGTMGGVEYTSSAFESQISWFPYVLSVAVILFALSTMIAWAYYGRKGATYLFGESKLVKQSFNVFFCIFIFFGCTVELKAVLDFSDAIIFVMVVPNLLGLYFMAPVVKRELKSYFERLASGEIKSNR